MKHYIFRAISDRHRKRMRISNCIWPILNLVIQLCVCCWEISPRFVYSTSLPSHRRTLVPSCVNGDIEVKWEWSNFDPSQNPNSLTHYDKTLHHWLSPRDEHIAQNLGQSTVREHLGKYVKYKAWSFLFLFIFPRTCLHLCTHRHAQYVIILNSSHGSAFWGLHRWNLNFDPVYLQKTRKLVLYAGGQKENNVIVVNVQR